MTSGHDVHGEGCTCDCDSVERKLAALLDDELTAAECAQLRAEITACPECAAGLELEEALRKLLRTCCGADHAPSRLRERVTYQLRVTTVRRFN
ncbi:hypothetical protein CFRA_03070 [Corynebacterium frankenforstense DSM 45800]|uniref:Putative zinc-finger domain-containing protein n=1 Tax=Corynebacterium frankenforstense DSM 45800 TaxID=1437875 RepID=A0A1L7CRG0_9CORY|nr:mycothiol system anti-sigma-R factor [Corynebacterium frankenforstense]APT88426.1 hypothetical protein CFRA_03070 [Corynebacterium frankenforstense DSM 45800]